MVIDTMNLMVDSKHKEIDSNNRTIEERTMTIKIVGIAMIMIGHQTIDSTMTIISTCEGSLIDSAQKKIIIIVSEVIAVPVFQAIDSLVTVIDSMMIIQHLLEVVAGVIKDEVAVDTADVSMMITDEDDSIEMILGDVLMKLPMRLHLKVEVEEGSANEEFSETVEAGSLLIQPEGEEDRIFEVVVVAEGEMMVMHSNRDVDPNSAVDGMSAGSTPMIATNLLMVARLINTWHHQNHQEQFTAAADERFPTRCSLLEATEAAMIEVPSPVTSAPIAMRLLMTAGLVGRGHLRSTNL